MNKKLIEFNETPQKALKLLAVKIHFYERFDEKMANEVLEQITAKKFIIH